jgi:alpha,alpha-trehalose phosphorylase
MASLAGAWTALVEGFGGMRARAGRLAFCPRVPSDLGRLSFRVRYRGSGVQVTTDGKTATYHLWTGPPLTIWHEGEPLELAEHDVERPVTPVQAGPPPTQPAGREPERRGA